LQADGDGGGGIVEGDLAEGVGGVEGGGGEAGQAVVVYGAALEVVVFGLVERTEEGAGEGGVCVGGGVDGAGVEGEERGFVAGEDGGIALGGAVHDFPVAEFTATAEGDGAGADAA
jgi:hypothetical protein